MKKPFKFNELSDVTCDTPHCNEKLKKNLIARKPTARWCFKHWIRKQRAKGHLMYNYLTLKNK